MEDTIAAISTPVGEGGIAIIRMSGSRALAIADRIFESKGGKPSDFPSHTIHFGRIHAEGNSVDQVMLTVLRAPRTYTKEDVIEINCHGGAITARSALALCLRNGARPAEPGEFTKRAFLNGRIDLTQAEAVMDLITAKSVRAHAVAERTLEGHLTKRIEQARDRLMDLIAHVEAHIDFPEEEIDTGTGDEWLNAIEGIVVSLNEILATAHDGMVLRSGLSVVIVGRPNVGKSSLMNALLGEDRAIVTAIPGTTRDALEEIASIRGVPVRLTDTAGIRRARGSVEAIGIARSHNTLLNSDLVLRILDGSRAFSKDECQLEQLCHGRHRIYVINKCDLPAKLRIPAGFCSNDPVFVSALTGQGLDELKDRIAAAALTGPESAASINVAVNERQAEQLRGAVKYLHEATIELRRSDLVEVFARTLRLGLESLGAVVGSTATEDILDRIFSRFCIGK
jgi:tRNA modification GTPase